MVQALEIVTPANPVKKKRRVGLAGDRDLARHPADGSHGKEAGAGEAETGMPGIAVPGFRHGGPPSSGAASVAWWEVLL